MDTVSLELTMVEAEVLKNLLYCKVCGSPDNSARGEMDKVSCKLSGLGVNGLSGGGDLFEINSRGSVYFKSDSNTYESIKFEHNPAKEVTMADIEAKFGCKVKVVK